MLDQKLLDILACPACDDRPAVRLEGGELICDECGRAYPIRNDLPVMLADQARLTREQPGGNG